MDRRTLIKGLAAFAPLAGVRRLAAEDSEAPAGSCVPLQHALVSIWHANAAGLYSGVENIMLDSGDGPTGERIDTRGSTFLRGLQRTDRDGRVTFRTIFPGWYYPRPTHLHLVVTPPNYGETSTTQLYFPDTVCGEAYRAGPYAARGPNPVRSRPEQACADGQQRRSRAVAGPGPRG